MSNIRIWHSTILTVGLFAVGTAAAENEQAGPIRVCVGEAIELPGEHWHARGLTDDAPIDDLRNIAMADYAIAIDEGTKVTATQTPLAAGDSSPSSSVNMRFFFHKPGQYLVTTTHADKQLHNYPVVVTAPEARTTRITTSSVYLYSAGDRPLVGLGRPGEPGLEFEFAVDMGNCAGEIGDVQTLSFTDTESVDEGELLVHSSSGEATLDYEPGYDTSWHYDFRESAGFNERLELRYEDSPKIFLSSEQLCVASEAEFHYYVLFRSASPGAVWVPIAELDWQLGMSAGRASEATPWLHPERVEVSGAAVVPETFAEVVAHWPTWTRGWQDVEMVKSRGSCPSFSTAD